MNSSSVFENFMRNLNFGHQCIIFFSGMVLFTTFYIKTCTVLFFTVIFDMLIKWVQKLIIHIPSCCLFWNKFKFFVTESKREVFKKCQKNKKNYFRFYFLCISNGLYTVYFFHLTSCSFIYYKNGFSHFQHK